METGLSAAAATIAPTAAPVRADGSDPLVSLVELDFKTKAHGKICIGDLRSSMDAGRFVWIDVDVAQQGEARALLGQLDLCLQEIVEDALTREPATQVARYEDYVHLVLSGCRLAGHKFDRAAITFLEDVLVDIRRDTGRIPIHLGDRH